MSVFFILLESRDKGKTWEAQYDKTYPTGQEAQAKAKELNDYYRSYQGLGYGAYYDRNYRVRKVVETDSDNYIAREAALNHKPVPWDTNEYKIHTSWLLPHIDPDQPFNIRFFRRLSDAIEGKYTSQRITRFIDNYLSMDEEDVQELCVKIGMYKDAEFGITNDPELIQHVYANGPSSCMSEDDGDLPSDPHPVAVYGGEGTDFSLAYIKNGDNYSARAIVCHTKKLWCTAYGHTTLLKKHLEEAGYTKTDRYRDFTGTKVRAIRDGGGDWLMPYIDFSCNADLDADEQFFTIDPNGDYDVQSTSGYAYYNGHDSYEDDY